MEVNKCSLVNLKFTIPQFFYIFGHHHPNIWGPTVYHFGSSRIKIYILCASITHWLGSISKLPNQCENISIFFWPFWKLPNQCTELPNQCEMLAHPPCASISHWLGSFQKILGSFQVYQIYQNYPINVKCLHRGGAQAFHID